MGVTLKARSSLKHKYPFITITWLLVNLNTVMSWCCSFLYYDVMVHNVEHLKNILSIDTYLELDHSFRKAYYFFI